MTKLKAVWALIGILTLCFALTLGYSVTSHSELRRYDMQMLEESRRYTDTKITESQNATQGAIADVSKSISDVSKATILLSRILCLMQKDNVIECERQLGVPLTIHKEN
jgi:hypothetical protein